MEGTSNTISFQPLSWEAANHYIRWPRVPSCLALSTCTGGNGTEVSEGAGSKEPGGSLQVPAGTAGDGTHHPLGWQVSQEEEEEEPHGEEGLGRAGRIRLAQR